VSEKEIWKNAATKTQFSVENFFDGPVKRYNAFRRVASKITLLSLLSQLKSPTMPSLQLKYKRFVMI
jgi:hypothetical protein